VNWHLNLESITLLRPHALYLLIGAAVVLAWSMLSVDAPRKIFAPIIRTIVLALAILALAGPEQVVTYHGKARPAVVDLSGSMTSSMRAWTVKLLQDGLKLRSDDPAIAFAKKPVLSDVRGIASMAARPAGCQQCESDATDLETALRDLAAQGEGSGGPVVLVTDGWENRGDARAATSALLAAHSRLYVFTPPGAGNVANVAMTELSLPHALSSVEPFALGVTMLNMNDAPVQGTIKVFENNRQVDQRQVTLPSGRDRVDFPVRATNVGLVSYRATFDPAVPAQDLYKEDNTLQGWIGIGARRKVLIIADKPRDASYLETAVKRMGLDAEVADVSAHSGPFDRALSGYDAVILDNVARSRLSAQFQAGLANYVQRGGSLAMVGGDDSFGLGGYHGSAVETAMPVIMKPPEHKKQQRALILIIDKSGSMNRDNKLTYAKAAARQATQTLGDDDLLSVIGFDAQPFVVVPLQPLRESRPYLDQMIGRLKAKGTTYLLPALKQAESDLADSRASIKHVVILTDGETGGTAAMYYDLVSSMHRQGGVTISTIAIGRDPNLQLLNAIAQYGGGGFYHTDSATTLPELFLQDVRQHTGEMTLVEKDFQPRSSSPNAVLKELAGRKLPTIKGYVSTELKPHADLDMYIDRSGRREPLIASWRYGAGKAVAVTTDANGRWSAEWIRENVFTPLWDRLIGWMTPEVTTAPKVDVALGYSAGRLHLRLTDYDETAPATRMIDGTVSRPDGSTSELVLSEETLGEMTASFDAPRPGTYYIQLKSSGGAKGSAFPPLAYTVSPAAMAELPRPAPNYDLLERLASATGGRLNPALGEIALARPTLEQRASLSSYLLLAAMILLIGEALVRRLTA
jgi:Ca-activated chloride channel family protein